MTDHSDTHRLHCHRVLIFCCFLDFPGRPTILRANHGYIGVGDPKELSNTTSSPNNYWRIICPSVDYEIYIVLMGLHLAPNAYLHVKTTKFEGCTDKYHGRHFHKRSILVGYFSNSAVMSAFKMAYVCVGKLIVSLMLVNYYPWALSVHCLHGV